MNAPTVLERLADIESLVRPDAAAKRAAATAAAAESAVARAAYDRALAVRTAARTAWLATIGRARKAAADLGALSDRLQELAEDEATAVEIMRRSIRYGGVARDLPDAALPGGALVGRPHWSADLDQMSAQAEKFGAHE